ncbi:hypothetical protein [Williamsia deligens]|uniref:Tail terminator n=1 Tax=Williamsia deligens TaxID=321325 RepID=A0ABW3GH51_9NOCA|nr:hypothetical protein [Williamsia deligens]MCP2196286.1 hypothetical protein [Williamsia deligens]
MTSVVAAGRAILVAALPGVPVSQKVTSTPRRYVRLSRAGGDRGRTTDRPELLVECYASTDAGAPDGPQAERDVTTAYDALRDAAGGGPWAGGWVTKWEGNSIVDYDDPDQPKHARWQFTGTLFLLT